MEPIRLLHTSDVHIGGGFRAPEHGHHEEACLCPLAALEQAAMSQRPDAVLVAGDLFDNNRVGPELVSTVLERLGRLPAPCVVINGNHDVHDETSRYEPELVDGSGVVFLDDPDGSTIELLGGGLQLWGKAMPLHHQGFRPLADVPARPRDDAWWVVLGHGHHQPGVDEGPMGRSSPLSPQDIEATAADYVALGHWHVRTDVSAGGVTAWYSGAPYGFAATERFNVIDLDPGAGVTVDSVPVLLDPSGCAANRSAG